MKQQDTFTDERLWAEVQDVFADNRRPLDETEWDALTREVSDEDLVAAGESSVRPTPVRRIALWTSLSIAAALLLAAYWLMVPQQPAVDKEVLELLAETDVSAPEMIEAPHPLLSAASWDKPQADPLAEEDILGIRGYFTDSRTLTYQRAMNLNREDLPIRVRMPKDYSLPAYDYEWDDTPTLSSKEFHHLTLQPADNPISPEREAQLLAIIEEMEPEVNAYLAQISEQAASLQSQVRKRLYEVDRQARDIELQLQAEEAQLYYTIFPNCH